jgi:hypothetical protein
MIFTSTLYSPYPPILIELPHLHLLIPQVTYSILQSPSHVNPTHHFLGQSIYLTPQIPTDDLGMPPYRTQDDVSYQQYQHERAWPYIIPGHLPAFPAQSTHMATMEMGGPSHYPTPYRPVPPSFLPNYGSSGPRFIQNVNGTVNMVDQTIPQLPIRPVDDLGHMEPGQNGHLGENGSHVGPRIEDALVAALVDGCEGDSENLESILAPYLEALQSQTDTLLAEGYGAGSDTRSCQLDAELLESINTIIGQSGDPLDEGNQPRSPTPTLTTEAASAEQNTTGSEFHHLHDGGETGVFGPTPEMVEHPTMDWLEENCFNRPLFHSASDGSISTRRLATDDSIATSANRLTGLDRDGTMIPSPPTIEHSHPPSRSAPSRPWLRPTPPLMEGPTGSEPIRPDLVSASSSAYFQRFLATPFDGPSTSSHPSVESRPPKAASNIPPAHCQSSGSQLPSNATGYVSQTRHMVKPSLGLISRPRQVDGHSQMVQFNASQPAARIDHLPQWIDHIQTLTTLAMSLKPRDPLPGADKAFVSFRSLFVELISLSAKASMGGVLTTVSRLLKAIRPGTVTDGHRHLGY